VSARPVILDMDIGVDDAIALLYLGRQASISIEAIGTVHGNVSAEGAAENALHVLALMGRPDVPVAIGARRPLVRDVQLGAEVHGDDGLGNRRPEGRAGTPTGESAPEQLVRLARSAPGHFEILATGPLTNLAMALILEPNLPSLVSSVRLMGGAAAAIGNISATAEANIWHDPEAAALVFAARWPITMVGLDVTSRTILDEAAIETIARGGSPTARFVSAILPHYLDFYESISGRRACPLHDPTAAAVLADPTLVTEAIEADVNVAVGDEARGMTIVDRRRDGQPVDTPSAPVTRIVLAVDAARFVPALVEALTA
jgi:purine nucleosidase